MTLLKLALEVLQLLLEAFNLMIPLGQLSLLQLVERFLLLSVLLEGGNLISQSIALLASLLKQMVPVVIRLSVPLQRDDNLLILLRRLYTCQYEWLPV